MIIYLYICVCMCVKVSLGISHSICPVQRERGRKEGEGENINRFLINVLRCNLKVTKSIYMNNNGRQLFTVVKMTPICENSKSFLKPKRNPYQFNLSMILK